jgi:hypothetical protein
MTNMQKRQISEGISRCEMRTFSIPGSELAQMQTSTNSPFLPSLHSGRGCTGYRGPSRADNNLGDAQLVPGHQTLGVISFKEATMLSTRTVFAVTLLLPFLGASFSAQAAKVDVKAARAECFRQANAAVANIGFSPGAADRNSVGTDAYRACCYKAGIRP